MARQVESTHAWYYTLLLPSHASPSIVKHVSASDLMQRLESITYQLSTMSHAESVLRLAGPLALLKAQATTTFEFCAREAAQIFGGLAYTRGGQVSIMSTEQ
jgi:alkylation response protein AidB-like acyl-CoA dehydrogenase